MTAPDPAFPAAHLRPRTGWVNDPNGPFRWKGRYHVFFQHNPAGPLHGDICWGHASSADLATWRVEPLALAPTPDGPDAGGCWSGCVVDDGGTPTAVYTGFVDDPRTATIVLARAQDDDLRHWVKVPGPVAGPPHPLAGFRDPFLLDLDGHRYAVVGAGTVDGTAQVLVFRCDDLLAWEYAGVLLDARHEVAAAHAAAEIWECPQLFRLGDRWVLAVSLVVDDSLSRVAYLVGDLHVDGGLPRFRPAGGGLVDHGHDCYAPAVLVEEERVLLWGWTWEDRAEEEVLEAGWAGALTWPRELVLSTDDRLTSRPAAEVRALRRTSEELALTPDRRHTLRVDNFELETEVREPLQLELRSGTGRLVVDVDPDRRRAAVQREPAEQSRAAWLTAGGVAGEGPVRLRVVVDGSVVEVYVADGPTFTERVYPTGHAWELAVTGAARSVTLHTLGRAVGSVGPVG